MIDLKNIEIETDLSFLNIYKFNDTELLDKCIEESKYKLNISRYRKVGFFSDIVKQDYMYGKIKVCPSQKLTPSLKEILGIVNERYNSDYNGILINYYKDGNNYIEKHSDSLNHPKNGVLIISYGSERNFRVYNKKTDEKIKDIQLINGEVLHMGGDFQAEFKHDIEKDDKIKTERYSISFHKYMNLGLYH
jgi:alkylated DNA repair dioxygenase AlkB